MQADDKEIILSVVVSTFNRAQLVYANLKRMLSCKSDRVEFIVGDNASEDNTLEMLYKLEDYRVKIFRNEENYGALNFQLLAYQYARGKYFIYVNDRDYIKAQDLDKLCGMLTRIKECDYIFGEPNIKQKDGYYTGKIIPWVFMQARHPGTFIILTQFYRRNVNKDKLNDLKKGERNIGVRIVFALLYNISNIYVYKKWFVHQPSNREELPQFRKELYGDIYISPYTRIQEFDLYCIESKNYTMYPLVKEILLAKYENSLTIVTYEYYTSMKKKGFAERYHYTDHSAGEWFKNGIIFAKSIFFSGKIKDKELLLRMVAITVKRYYEITMHIVREELNAKVSKKG